jgi:carboxyl-terminal processing protease
LWLQSSLDSGNITSLTRTLSGIGYSEPAAALGSFERESEALQTMTQRILAKRRGLFLLATVAGLILASTRALAEPVPGKQDPLVVRLVCTFLKQGHLSRPEIGDDLSKRLFHRFLKDLDSGKLYFLKSDIDEFSKSQDQLADMLLKGDISFAYKVYERYVQRIGERQKLIQELLKENQDFTVKEYLDTDFDSLDYAQTTDELRDRWRKRIKFDLLLNRLAKKPMPEAEAKQKVQSRYQGVLKRWKQVDNYDLMELYLSDLAACVDPHSGYMSPPTLDDFDIAMRLNLEGIGALLRSDNGQTLVVEVVPGGAAAADGRLKSNDKIIGVAQGDGKFVDVVDMKLREVVKLIRGASGTPVQLKVIPAGKIEPLVYDLTRQTIQLKDQEARRDLIELGKKSDGKPYRIGVIDLPSFYADMARIGQSDAKSATEDVRAILSDFKAKNVDGVILDLRQNGGGSLTEALGLTGLFIDHGPIVQVKGSQGRVQRKDSPHKGMAYSGPLIVLVSRLSASASEILAGALQDYGRALVVGDSSTHGKGTVQMVIDIGNQLQADPPPKLGALKLTIQQFYRANGDSTQNRGVASDIVIPSVSEYLATGEKELEHALAFDKVKPVSHEQLAMVSPELISLLKVRSAERVKNSKDFAKLAKELELIKARKESKKFPLSEKELRDQFTKEEAEKADQTLNGDLPPEPKTDAKDYKFQRNFTNNEILAIMEDLLRGKELAQSR